mmetsp:Transcript_47619/g.146739  ORF Transcript_47619/g.146739 Transcript_47619/m.146739 type:complete len:463 (+) Transcript_47619:77-1465(+)
MPCMPASRVPRGCVQEARRRLAPGCLDLLNSAVGLRANTGVTGRLHHREQRLHQRHGIVERDHVVQLVVLELGVGEHVVGDGHRQCLAFLNGGAVREGEALHALPSGRRWIEAVLHAGHLDEVAADGVVTRKHVVEVLLDLCAHGVDLRDGIPKGVQLGEGLLGQVADGELLVAPDGAAVDEHNVGLVHLLHGVGEEVGSIGLVLPHVRRDGVHGNRRAAKLLAHLLLAPHLPVDDLVVQTSGEWIRIGQGQELALHRLDPPVVCEHEGHDPGCLEVGVRLDVRCMTAHGLQLRAVVVPPQYQVDILADGRGELAVLHGELVRQGQHDLAAVVLAEGLGLLGPGLRGALVGDALLVLEHGLTHIICGAKQADAGGLQVLAVRPPLRIGDVQKKPLLGAGQEAALLVHEVDVQPRELRLLDPLLQCVHAEVELVVAQRGRREVQVVQDVDHLLALEEVAQHGG